MRTVLSVAVVLSFVWGHSLPFSQTKAGEKSPEAASQPGTPLQMPASSAESGLRAEYFNGLNLTNFAFARIDEQIDFKWGSGSPAAGIDAERFSVRWSGQVTAPASGLYTFHATSDDGVRVWVDGQLIIDEWNDHSLSENSGTITLKAGKAHDISVEYCERTGGAVMQLGWTPPSGTKEVIPATRLTHVRMMRGGEPLGAPQENPDRLVVWLTIGFSANAPADRNVGWSLKKLGWAGFVEQIVKPHIRWGARRIVLGNPFGALSGEPMQFDQYVHASEEGKPWLTDGFVEAWRPITESGIEVIGYLGSIPGDPDFNGAPDEWQPRFWQSINPVLDAGMNVAFDAVSLSKATSTAYSGVKLAEARGAKVYIEPRPHKSQPHWHGYPIISVDSFWKRSDPSAHADSANWAASEETLSGEIIRLITAPPTGATWADLRWLPDEIRAIISSGHTAAIGGSLQMVRRFRYKDLSLER